MTLVLSDTATIINLYSEWLKKAMLLSTGQTIYIQVETKEEQKILFKGLSKELVHLRKTVPIEASTVVLGKTFRDSRYWVTIHRAAATPYTGFIKDTDGTISRIAIHHESNTRRRRLYLMVSDGITQEEIEATEGKLTLEEMELLWPQPSQSPKT